MIKNNKFNLVISFVSAMSLAFMISSGILYLSFLNSFVFTDLKIEITNNPITNHDDINFMLTGTKRYECNSVDVWGSAIPHNNPQAEPVILNQFVSQYTHNVTPGTSISNNWTLAKPDAITPGLWNVTMHGEFECVYFILKAKKTQSYNNIRLEVK